MARSKQTQGVDFTTFAADIEETDVVEEMTGSYLEYAALTIGGRALPDARDGLKPVHRRILYSAYDNGVTPDKSFVKVARLVGATMGAFHPHGDAAIADALVRMAQDFSLRCPLMDGHGNFGSPDTGAASMRYIEARLSKAGLSLLDDIRENTVDMVPNYDGSEMEPSVLPAAFPNLLVNGSEGIAVGLSTKMIPHNLGEAVAAARHLLAHPDADVKALMKHLKGPDLPSGGVLIGMDGVVSAYETGSGVVRLRATATIDPIEGSRGRQQITITELPYGVGCERIIEAVKKGIGEKKIQGVSDIVDLSNGDGTRLVVELKAGVDAEAMLATLYKNTPMEVSFGINNLALVDGQPTVLGLIDMLSIFLNHRKDVVRRRSEFRKEKAEARLHLVDGLLIALGDINEVIRLIRAAKTTADAKVALQKAFTFSDVQVAYVLEMPLRRLTALEIETLESEARELRERIADLTDILARPERLTSVVDEELAAAGEAFATPRRTTLVAGALEEHVAQAATVVAEAKNKVDDTPIALTVEKGVLKAAEGGPISTTVGGVVLAVDTKGVAHRVNVAGVASAPKGVALATLLGKGASVVGVVADNVDVLLVCEDGTVKVTKPDYPARGESFPIIKDGAVVVHAGPVVGENIVMVTSDARLLAFPANKVNAQGRTGGGVAGMKVNAGERVVLAGTPTSEMLLVTTTDGGKGKSTAVGEYPVKGRAGGGVACHKFLRGDTCLVSAEFSPVGAKGLPPVGKRDAAGK